MHFFVKSANQWNCKSILTQSIVSSLIMLLYLDLISRTVHSCQCPGAHVRPVTFCSRLFRICSCLPNHGRDAKQATINFVPEWQNCTWPLSTGLNCNWQCHYLLAYSGQCFWCFSAIPCAICHILDALIKLFICRHTCRPH